MSLDVDRLTKALADRYSIVRELGRGGMATVFLAEDLRQQRTVAIKVLRDDLAAALGGERFLREIQIAAGLSHPHIVPLYESGEADGFLFYVMPHVEADTLRKRLDTEKQLGLHDALRIAAEVARALSYAHEQGVLHRDIKPANILLTAGHAVVADFGLGRAVEVAGEDRLTETGVVLGTPSYMSPEHSSDEDVDARSDIYELGCVLYEMLAGQAPFTGPTSESVRAQHISVEAPSVTAIRPSVPADVDAAIQRALQKAPADRYASAVEFADELELAAARVKLSGPTTAARRLVTGPTAATGRPRPVALLYGAVAVVVLAIVFMVALGVPSDPGGGGLRMTVIPFENLGSPDQEYFATGIADEITTRLAAVGGLSIIARQSAAQYKGTQTSPQQIGEDLGVDFFLTSTVSWEESDDGTSTVRVRPQLIRTADASQVWAQAYQADLTGVFEVQADIAQQVVEALGVALLEGDRRALETRPTEDMLAYDYYLRASAYARRTITAANLEIAEGMYVQALDRDPRFARAAARLSTVHSLIYFYYFDRTDQRLEEARRWAERAIELAPDDPESHLALGEFYYRGLLDYERALEQFEIVRRERPDDAELLVSLGAVERRRGNWAEAAGHFGRAADLDPSPGGAQSALRGSNAIQAGLTHLYLREYAEAEDYFDRAILLAPDQLRPRVWMARLLMSSTGDTAAVRAQFAAGDVLNPTALDPQAWWHWALFRVLDGASAENFSRLRALREDPAFVVHTALAELHALAGEDDLARVHYDSSRVHLEAQLAARPADARVHSELGIALAGLGRREDAIREGTTATDLMPVAAEAVLGPDWVRNLAQIYAMLGMRDEAVEQLESLFTRPSGLSAHWLRLDPIWSSLTGHPRFDHLVASASPSN